MSSTNDAKLTITAQHETDGMGAFVRIALIVAPITAFVSLFVGVILFFVLVMSGVIPEPEPAGRAVPIILLLAAGSWLVLYGLFLGKMYYNFSRSARDVENAESEGEYRFYDDHMVASMAGQERALAYEDLECVERRGDEAFAFYPSEIQRRSGLSPIVFGLTEDQRDHQADAFWAQVKRLVEGANPECDFYTLERGSRRPHVEEKAPAQAGEPLPEPPPDVEFTPESERIERIIDEQPEAAGSVAEVDEDCILTFYAHETNPDAADDRGREIVLVDVNKLKIQRLEVRGDMPEDPAEGSPDFDAETVLEVPLTDIEDIEPRNIFMEESDGPGDVEEDRREFRWYVLVAYRVPELAELQHLSVGARIAPWEGGRLRYERHDDPRFTEDAAHWVARLLRAAIEERWKEAAPAKYWDRCVSIQEKARRGSLTPEGEVGEPPGDKLHVGRRDGNLRIWERPRIGLGAMFVPALIAGGLIAGGVFGDVLPLIIVGVIVALVAVLVAFLRFAGRNELHLSPEGIIHYTYPFPYAWAREMPADTVNRVKVAKWKNSQGERTDRDVLEIHLSDRDEPTLYALGASREELTWLKDIISQCLADSAGVD
jgi:hypothetical protein